MQELVLKSFKKLLSEEKLNYTKAYLFGSRARNNNTIQSDWDFLIILNKKTSSIDTRTIKNNIRMKFHNAFNYPIDIVIKDQATFSQEKNIPNTISFNAIKEGIAL